MTTETRLAKVETDIVLLGAGQTELKADVNAFREEWRAKAEEDRKSHRAARLSPRDIVTMLAATVTMTAVLLGGLMYLINVQVASARSDLAGQIGSAKQSGEATTAQVGLTVRGLGDSVVAANTAIQGVQRDQGEIKVKLGLVEQMAAANSKFIDQAQGFDALMARQDEKMRALEQVVRDMAARRTP